MSAGFSTSKEIVILVHGFNNNEADMFPLRDRLTTLGYAVVTANLPLSFASLEECLSVFSDQVQPILSRHYSYTKIHLVGYSMGGLIVRAFLANNVVVKLGRCVLIATPNRGTKLADIANNLFKPLVHIYKPLESLKTGVTEYGEPLNAPQPEIGVIAGDANKHLLGFFLAGANDGRVEVESALYSGMADFVIRSYGHKEIHHQPETAQLVHSFLHTGKFLA
jgi:uncharacterized alpha/beta hydrolase family protein